MKGITLLTTKNSFYDYGVNEHKQIIYVVPKRSQDVIDV